MYSRRSRPRRSVVRAWIDVLAVPVELRRVGGEAALVGVELGREQLDAARLERDVVVAEQDVVGSRPRARRRCRGAEAAFGAQEPRAELLGDARLPSVEARVDDDHLAGAAVWSRGSRGSRAARPRPGGCRSTTATSARHVELLEAARERVAKRAGSCSRTT